LGKTPFNFALIGAAGYIAPRHLTAIRDTGNRLIAALDPNDSVGILDRFFDEVDFFTEFERFDRHAEKLRRLGDSHRIHYVSICSPNYLHDAHIRFALRIGAHAICEKPLVLNPWNLDVLEELESESGHQVFTILQLRLHPVLIALREKIRKESSSTKHDVELTYITSRGKWYFFSWKGDEKKSGGIATNIGIHFFDILLWIFGPLEYSELHLYTASKASGYLELKKAKVKWFLSVDKNDLPINVRGQNKSTYRSIRVDGEEVEFSEGFENLHTSVYQAILDGHGFGIKEARPSVELTYHIRHAPLIAPSIEKMHPWMKK